MKEIVNQKAMTDKELNTLAGGMGIALNE